MADTKSRHGCLTAWLVVIIVANSATTLTYLLASDAIRQTLPNIPEWAFPVLIVFSLFNLVCAAALFKWKKWGFWGFCVSSVVALGVNLSVGFGIFTALSGLIGIVLLYAVLQIGKENKGWPQLE
jgi:hypothetical protein